jgi:hypothetical protein
MRKSLCALAIAVAAITSVRAQEKKEMPKDGEMKCCAMDPKAQAALAKIRALEGKWVGTKSEPGSPPVTTEFRPTANGTAVIETMMAGQPHEMINLYTASGDTIIVTHYCAMGVQPRMKLSNPGDAKEMKFEFVDGGNIKSRDEGHMDSLTLSVDGDKLTQNWSYFADGKITGNTVFELKKQK